MKPPSLLDYHVSIFCHILISQPTQTLSTIRPSTHPIMLSWFYNSRACINQSTLGGNHESLFLGRSDPQKSRTCILLHMRTLQVHLGTADLQGIHPIRIEIHNLRLHNYCQSSRTLHLLFTSIPNSDARQAPRESKLKPPRSTPTQREGANATRASERTRRPFF